MPNVTHIPTSFADLVGDTPEEAAAREARYERRKAAQAKQIRKQVEAERAVELAKREAHLPAVVETGDEAHDAREHRIRNAIKSSLTQRLAMGLDPMKPKQLAVELAHFNMVHLSSHSTEILERVAEYARDATSAHHEWALKFMAERALPLKLAQDAQLDAAGLSERGAAPRAPEVHIHVNAAGPVRQSDIIDAIPIGTADNGQ